MRHRDVSGIHCRVRVPRGADVFVGATWRWRTRLMGGHGMRCAPRCHFGRATHVSHHAIPSWALSDSQPADRVDGNSQGYLRGSTL